MRLEAALLVLACCVCGCAAHPTNAGEVGASPDSRVAPRVPGAIEATLFSPELVLSHADEIELTTAARATIARDASETQAALHLLDAQLDSRVAVLAAVLATSPIDEDAAIAEARQLAAVEDDIKLTHLRMLVRIRNALTATQREQLTRVRAQQ
jgi:Spy/CpxP family protein refolding chaperone